MNYRLPLFFVLVYVHFATNAQSGKGILISVGNTVYAARTHVSWDYHSNFGDVNLKKRSLNITKYTLPVSLDIGINSAIAIRVCGEYGKLIIHDKRNTSDSPNRTYSFGLALHGIQYAKPGIRAYANVGIVASKLKISDFDPYFVGYETPYHVHTDWTGFSTFTELGAMFFLNHQLLGLNVFSGWNFSKVNLSTIRFGNVNDIHASAGGHILSRGLYFGVGLVFRSRNAKQAVVAKS